MRPSTIRPTGVERTLSVDEIIVTKTDPRGIITYANPTFLHFSALTEDEALGRPHNLIRHPDMPRAVFQLLWDTVGRGEEIFAYIVNLASDGAHYWVLAHVTPSYDAGGRLVGYHSNRRAPRREAVERARAVYDELLAVERATAGARQAVAASTAALESLLRERGQTYEELVWQWTNEATA